MDQIEEKRLFFALDIHSPWPEKLPQGRILEEKNRHLTLAFLGQVDYAKLKNMISELPLPRFKVGLAGRFDQCLFLPPRHPRVAAWHIDWLEDSAPLLNFRKELIHALEKKEFSVDVRHDFNSHVTLSRAPFDQKGWEKTFSPLPCFAQNLHLYESIGFSQFKPLWSHSLKLPFEEIDHTADIGYLVRGGSFLNLYEHAFLALSFTFPPLLPFFVRKSEMGSLQEVIFSLNQIVSYADQEVGCPFKAVSYHGKVEQNGDILEWEIIIDV